MYEKTFFYYLWLDLSNLKILNHLPLLMEGGIFCCLRTPNIYDPNIMTLGIPLRGVLDISILNLGAYWII